MHRLFGSVHCISDCNSSFRRLLVSSIVCNWNLSIQWQFVCNGTCRRTQIGRNYTNWWCCTHCRMDCTVTKVLIKGWMCCFCQISRYIMRYSANQQSICYKINHIVAERCLSMIAATIRQLSFQKIVMLLQSSSDSSSSICIPFSAACCCAAFVLDRRESAVEELLLT
jgi:hypothetical protein